MKKIIYLIILIIPFCNLCPDELLPFNIDLIEKGYKKLGIKKGVTVYMHKNKKIVSVAAEGTIKADPKIVMEAIINYKEQEKTVGRLSESRIIKKGPGWLIVYHHLNLPVISDRDYTLHVKFGNKNGIYQVHCKAITNYGPEKRKRIVRVTNHEAGWQLKPINKGKETFVRFQMSIDMGGLLPRWIVRRGSANELPEVFEGMRELVK